MIAGDGRSNWYKGVQLIMVPDHGHDALFIPLLIKGKNFRSGVVKNAVLNPVDRIVTVKSFPIKRLQKGKSRTKG
jgi:hypothetical protein